MKKGDRVRVKKENLPKSMIKDEFKDIKEGTIIRVNPVPGTHDRHHKVIFDNGKSWNFYEKDLVTTMDPSLRLTIDEKGGENG